MPESSSRHVAVEVGIQPPTIWIHQSFSHSLGQQTGEKRLADMRQASAAVLRGSQPTPYYFVFHLSQNLCGRALLDLVLLEQNMTRHLSDATPHVDHPGLLYVVFFLIFFRNHFRPTNTAKKEEEKRGTGKWHVVCTRWKVSRHTLVVGRVTGARARERKERKLNDTSCLKSCKKTRSASIR